MLDFFIALFGGAHYCGKLLHESNKMANAKYAEINRNIEYAYFEKVNSDKELEASIRAKLDDPEQREELWNRVSEVLHSLEHWKSYSRKEFDSSYPTNTTDIVLDILMADHGKIPYYRLRLGYNNSYYGKRIGREKYYEYIEWIGKRVKEMGSDAHLVKQGIVKPQYEFAWQGSRYYKPDLLIETVT